MKNILSFLLVLFAFTANAQIQEYVIEASDSLITRGVLQVGADKFKATTQVSSDDTTLVSLDYLINLLDNSEYADSLAFHSGTGYLVYYRAGVALDSTSMDGRYLTAEVDGSVSNELQNLSLGTATTTTQPINISSGTGVTLPAATIAAAGLMTSTDKSKLDNIEANANDYNHPTGFTDQPATALTGASVISQIDVTSEGHVQGVSTRSLSPVDIGAQVAGDYLPLSGGASYPMTGDLWTVGSNSSYGNPRSLKVGYTGSGYGEIGYGITYSSSGNTFSFADWATKVHFYRGIQVSSSTEAGTTGNNIDWKDILRASDLELTYKGYPIYHSGNFTAGTHYQAPITNPVTGTGITNYIPKFTGLSTLGNSLIYDNGTNVGIGTTTPSKLLEISTPNGTESSLRIRQLSQNYWDFKIPASTTRLDISDVDGTYLSILTGGYVGIGTTTPAQKLDVNGNIRVRGVGTNTTSTVLGLDSNGDLTTNVTITGGATWKGGWNASTNTPTLSDATGTNGWWYKVTIAGIQNLGSGSITFAVGDDVIHNGTVWQKFSASINEADPVFVASDVYDWTTADSINWSTAYGWGDHSLAGYLTSEVDGSITNELQNLSLGTVTTTTQPINISGGAGVTLPAATTSAAGLMSAADKTDLNKYLYSSSFIQTDLNTHTESNKLKYSAILLSSPNIFPITNNANAVLSINTYTDGTGTYYHQLGFSSDGNIYHRTWDNPTWHKLYAESNFTDNSTNWNAAYNDRIASAAFSGTTTKTLTLTQQDGGTVTANFTDDNTTYTGSAGVQLVGNDFRMNIGSLTTGAISAATHYIPWYQTTGAHWRTTLAELQAVAGYNAGKLQNVTVSSTAPTTDYVLKYNGSVWAPAPDATGAGALTSGDAINVTGDSINYKPTRITATMTDLNMLNNAASIVTNFEYGGAIYRTTLGQLSDLGLYNARELRGYTIASATPSTGEVLKWTGSQWEPEPDATGGMTDPMTSRGDIIYRNSSNVTTRLASGTSGQLLYSNGTDIYWRSPIKSDIGLGNVENTALSTWTGSTNLQTVGSINAGTWNATPISAVRGGTGKTSYTAYALLAGGTTSTGTLQQVSGVGTAGQVLTSNGAGALPSWQAAPSGGGMTDPMTTAGDMIFRNGSNVTARLPKGAEGQILSISSGLPSWINNSSGGWVDNGANITLATSTDNVLIGTTIDSGFKLRVEGNSYYTGSVQVNGALIALKELRLSEYDVVGLGLNFDRPALFISPTDEGIKVKTTASGREIYNITPSVRANALNASSMRYYDGNHITDTLTVNTIYYITHIPQGGEGEILVKQDGTGGRTLTLYFYPYGQTGEPDSSTELTKVTVGATTGIKTTANKHTLIRYRRWGTKVTLEYLQEP